MSKSEEDFRSCANCGRPIDKSKRRGTIYCDTAACRNDRERRRQVRSRGKGAGSAPSAMGGYRLAADGYPPGSPLWWSTHGCDLERVQAHGIWRYSAATLGAVKALFERHLPPSRLGTVARVVNYETTQADGQQVKVDGLVMPKFDKDGRPSNAPQLRPDEGVILDRRRRWHDHGPHVEKRAVARVLFGRDGTPRLGKALPVAAARNLEKKGALYAHLIPSDLAQPHIDADKMGLYDPETGRGDHHKDNPIGLHFTAPEEAKYVLLGDSKHIDYGPGGIEPLRLAKRARFIMEGKLKHIAAESYGWPTISIASITLWNPREIKWLARWIAQNNPDLELFLGPDADWMNFKRNRGAVFRQAMYLRTIFRENGVSTYIASPPVSDGQPECKCKPVGWLGLSSSRAACHRCGGYLKGEDDFYGAGADAAELVVLDREEPHDHIAVYVYGLPIAHQRRPTAARALRGLSLHDRDDGDLLNVPLKTLQRIMGARRSQDVPSILDDLRGALEIDGSLEIEKREYVREDGSLGVAWDWLPLRRPRIRVRNEFRAVERKSTLEERDRKVTVDQLNQLTSRVDDLERRADERDQLEALDDDAYLAAMLAGKAERT